MSLDPTSLSPRQRDSLLRKYRALLQKHERLVERLEQRNDQRAWMFNLGKWLLRSHPGGVALVEAGSMRVTNPRFDELNRAAGEGWRRVDGGSPLFRDLRQVVRAEALLLLSDRQALRTLRYAQPTSERVLELRVERVGVDGEEVLVLAQELTDALKLDRELASHREQLARRGRLTSLGELCAGIAHDLDSTLLAARCWLGEIEAATPERRAAVVGLLRATLDDAGRRNAKLRDYARRRRPGQLLPVLLGPLLEGAAELARAAQKAPTFRVQLSRELARLPPVLGVEGELRFVFANVLLNALEAGGAVKVSASAAESVVVSVEDSGEGFAEGAADQAGRSLYSTKLARGGMGLGLTVANEVMRQSGGSLTLENREEGGARVSFTFRRSEVSPRPARAEARGSAPRSGSEAPGAGPPAAPPRRRAPRNGRSS